MKTRKVGKIVSLLVAIVLVATIMIPAASVLAAETYDRTVASNAELHSAIQYAYKKSLAGEITADRPLKVQLSGDIEVPAFNYTRIRENNTTNASVQGYIAAGTVEEDGKTYTNYEEAGSYEGTAIIIPENTYMVIDLNGHTIRLAAQYQSVGENGIPSPNDNFEQKKLESKEGNITLSTKNGMASVITVLGQLTLKDTSKAKTGTITGGVGNIIEAGTGGTKYTNYGHTVYQLDTYDWASVHHSSTSSKRVAGGGVYVKGANAVFNMEGGNITKNIAYASQGNNVCFHQDSRLTAVGGGVAVDDGATFNMSGGAIYNNNAKSYMTQTNTDGFHVQGGGVYLGTNATMNFTGGTVKDNSTFSRMAYSSSGADGTLKTQGGGIYVGSSALLNMYVADDVDEITESTVPSVVGNTCGGVRRSGSKTYMWAEGAGIYAAEGGYINLRRALITGNGFYKLTTDFSDYDKAVKNGDLDESKWTFDAVARDEDGKVHYQDDKGNTSYTDANGNTVDYIATDKYTAADGTEKYVNVVQASNDVKTTWIYPAQPGNKSLTTYTNGAGIFIDNKSTVNIGDGVWCYDNWDMITSTGSGITQDDVYITRNTSTVDQTDYSMLRLAAPATESKIGVNDQGSNSDRFIATESVRPTVVTQDKTETEIKRQQTIKDSYDTIFGDYKGTYIPSQTDVQFFWCNGLNEFDASQPEKSRPFRAVIFNDAVTNFAEDSLVPVSKAQLKFGDKSNAYSSDNYHGYVLRSFNEANLHQYANVSVDGAASWQNTKTSLQDFPDYKVNNQVKSYTLTLSRPNYEIYKGENWSSLRSVNGSEITVGTAGAPNSLAYDASLGGEASDLYFKGWEFYAPYGYKKNFDFMQAKVLGDQEYDLVNDAEHFTHSFTSKQLITWNNNLLHQSVPTYTAQFYSANELAAARHDLSVTKGALLINEDGKVYIRVAALLGGYQGNLNKLQPTSHTSANGEELYFNAPTFVASYTNATPTLEGGYKTTNQNGTKFEARVAKKLVSNGTNKKVTLDTWNYVPGNNSAFANDAWTQWNIGKNHHNKNGDSSFLGIMWVDIDTGITYDSETGKFVGDTSKVIYVTPCIEVTNGSGISATHNSYYYGASRAYSVDQLLAADGGINK